MIRRHLYLQICAIVVASLIGFTLLASIAWSLVGDDQYNRDLFLKSAALSEMLIPSIDESVDVQRAAIDGIRDALDIDLSLYSDEGVLMASAGSVVSLADMRAGLAKGAWHESAGGTRWTTRLGDGRSLAINLDRIALPDESAMFVMFLVMIGVGIAVIMYPFIRHLTGRLERLQLGVHQIGFGHLGARVEIEGKDEIAQLATSFNSAAERIERLVNSQQLLLANASHELRTPLARIRLGIEMLKARNDEVRRGALEQDVTELDVLIDELIMMTRINAGVGHDGYEPFDLIGLVAEECARYRGCEFDGSATSIKGDRRMVQHALRNLVDNAIKHGGPPVQVSVEINAAKAILSVSDGGAGISAVERDKMFEPFQRGRGKQNVPGNGLGLALVKRIAEAHNGSVSVVNEPVSTVSLIFPVYDEKDDAWIGLADPVSV